MFSTVYRESAGLVKQERLCTKSENPSHGSGWMHSSPFYMKALSPRSGNPSHGSVGIVQARTVYVRQDEKRSNVAEKQMNSSDLNDPHTAGVTPVSETVEIFT